MKIGLLGKKVGMTRIFRDNGAAVPVTVLEMEPSVVTKIKTKAKDGYSAIQLGYGVRKPKHITKSQKGFFEKIGVSCKNMVYEVRTKDDIDTLKRGDHLGVDNFVTGDIVDVSGISIGKGFQGVMKRHNFSGGRGSHGDGTGRRGGSIGQSSFPSRVFKGMKMPGRMGGENVTVQNLEVIKVDVDNNILVIQGAVPGPKNNVVRVNISLKKGTDKELKVKEKPEGGKTDETLEKTVPSDAARPQEKKVKETQPDDGSIAKTEGISTSEKSENKSAEKKE